MVRKTLKKEILAIVVSSSMLLVLMFVVLIQPLGSYRNTGLTVHLVKPGPILPAIQPLCVRVEPKGRVLIDSRAVPWDRFDSFIKAQLALRPPNWPVYVDGDPDINWREVAFAIDRLRGLHVEVALMPGTRRRGKL